MCVVRCADVSDGRFEAVSGRLSELVNKDAVIDIQLERIPLVHRATAVFCDSRAANYAILQSHPNSWLFFQSVCCSLFACELNLLYKVNSLHKCRLDLAS